MKIKFLQIFTIAALTIGAVSCKNDAKNKTEAADAETATEATAEAKKFMVDTSNSTIEWEGKKPTGTHTGTVSLESGVVRVDGDNISGSFLIDMKSITVTDLEGDQKANLEEHLKGTAKDKEDHFFNVNKYPTAAFEITNVSDKEGKTMIAGNLTIKEAKKNIEFPATYSIEGNTMTLTSEPFTIDRTDWNVNYGSKSVFDNLGNKFVNDDIQLEIKLTATQKQM